MLAKTAHQGRQLILDLDRDSGCSREANPGSDILTRILKTTGFAGFSM